MAAGVVGSGKYQYRLIKDWAKVPEGESLGLVSSGACDSNDRVYICQRKDPPIRIFDQEGNHVASWGEGQFDLPHGMSISDGKLCVADDWGHTCLVMTTTGAVIQTFGTRGIPSDTGYDTHKVPVPRAAGPFHRPTKLVRADDGDFYASDGYGNARIHRFASDGTLRFSWGTPGSHPGSKEGSGEFHIAHGLAVVGDRVYVADRENLRLQIFSTEGEHIDTWLLPRPQDVVADKDGLLYVCGRVQGAQDSWIKVMTPSGEVLAEFESRGGHSLWIDSKGSIYTGLGRHHESAADKAQRVRNPDYVPPTTYGGQGIVGAVDKFERLT